MHEGAALYSHRERRKKTPASNEKLLLSMALLDRVGGDFRFETSAAVRSTAGGVVPGNLWILGHGDPTLTSGGNYAEALSGFGATRLGALARRIKAGGIKHVQGSIVGGTGYFQRDWWAPGWEPTFPAEEVAIPTSLTFNGNQHHGRHIVDPERRAARWLTKKLRSLGVTVGGAPQVGRPPPSKIVVAEVRSKPLAKLMRFMNRNSSNFFAEVLGKRLAVAAGSGWGSIAKGARAIARFAESRGVTLTSNDSSGLSYDNRVAPSGIVKLLDASDPEWKRTLRSTLPAYGEGTLEDRYARAHIRAKTGTLENISALSGWVTLERSGTWAEFSIMSRGMPKSTAAEIEDRIVHLVARYAGPLATRGPVRSATPVAELDWNHRPLA
ncbi:MAG: hypothetical protein QOH90_1388 [Actinomycetota bacterium]|nr:hypothetical protein [Actinomycetota bacterium]